MLVDRFLWLSMVILTLFPVEAFTQSWIASTSPAANSCSAPQNTNITISFAVAVDPLTVTDSTVTVWAEQSGRHSVTCSYEQGTRTLTIDPVFDFFVGERVDVVLTRRILSDMEAPQPGYTFSFRIRTLGGSCLFDKRSELAMGPQSIDMLAHDFNRDGIVDFELLDIYPTNNCIFLVGYPSGGWTMPGHVYLAWPPVAMAVGDMDNDFRSDFAVAKGNDELAIVKNPGWGYGVGTQIPVGFSASRVECTDLDNDGWQDLLVARKSAHHLLVLMNSDSGSFISPASSLGPVSPASIVPTDIDQDGDMDLLVAQTEAGSLKLYRNNGLGAFVDSVVVTVGGNPTALAAGDLNGDGFPDVVSVDSAACTLTIVQNRGALGFTAATPAPVAGWGPNNVLLADFDGDRDLDIATLNRGSASVSIFKNLGGMSFTRLLVAGLDYMPNDFCAVDWDFDGDLDIVAISESTNAWNFLTNRAAAPRVSMKSWSMNFSGSTVDTVTTRKLWIYNVGGNTDLQIQVQQPPGPQFTCTPEFLSVAPNDSGCIALGFRPTSCSSYADTITLMHNDPLASPLKVPVQGYGKAIRSTNTGTQRAWQGGPLTVSMTFGEPMNPATLSDTTVSVYGSRSGRHHASNIAVSPDQRSATFEIDGMLLAEELVTVTLTKKVRTVRGPAVVAPYSWSFRMRSSQGTASFASPTSIGTMSQPIRVLAGDLQNDGFVDLVLATPQIMKLCTGSASGWRSITGLDSLGSDARPATGGSLADLAGSGGVGIAYGTWDDFGSETEGRFWSWTSPIRHLGATSDLPSGSATGDFDGDGDLDVAFSFMWEHSVQPFWNNAPQGSPGRNSWSTARLSLLAWWILTRTACWILSPRPTGMVPSLSPGTWGMGRLMSRRNWRSVPGRFRLPSRISTTTACLMSPSAPMTVTPFPFCSTRGISSSNAGGSVYRGWSAPLLRPTSTATGGRISPRLSRMREGSWPGQTTTDPISWRSSTNMWAPPRLAWRRWTTGETDAPAWS